MPRALVKLTSFVAIAAICQFQASADDSTTKGERIWSDMTVGHYTAPVTISDGAGHVQVREQQYQYETGVALVRDGKGCKVVSHVREGDRVLPTIVLTEDQKVREVPSTVPIIKTHVVTTSCSATPEDVRRIAATL